MLLGRVRAGLISLRLRLGWMALAGWRCRTPGWRKISWKGADVGRGRSSERNLRLLQRARRMGMPATTTHEMEVGGLEAGEEADLAGRAADGKNKQRSEFP
jgi:hypothetical protein